MSRVPTSIRWWLPPLLTAAGALSWVVAPAEADTGSTLPGASVGQSVSGACSTDAGPDGQYGTADDTYSDSVSAVVDEHGQYQLELSGEACWLSAPPPVPGAGDAEGEQQSSPPIPDAALVPGDLVADVAPGIGSDALAAEVVTGVRVERSSAVSRPAVEPPVEPAIDVVTIAVPDEPSTDLPPGVLIAGAVLVLGLGALVAGRPTSRFRRLIWR